ncbi:hypothetical protein C2G38_2213083 [Gigaspora rosea]|uniref:HAT C-terminal dimerisation domain-containing protein n=1 Tax=Gigaspora rosea TaxID=44941 RepID=A0A397UFD8_9GLOM|nr:hypothetical protein C2G38_2213083 [Gigaspora rosea]
MTVIPQLLAKLEELTRLKRLNEQEHKEKKMTFQNQETPLKLVPQKLAFNKHGRSHSAPGSQRFQQNLATAHELPLDTSVYNSDDELGQSPTSSRLDELYPPRNITSILLSDSFWQSIKSLHSLLHPYCEALNKLQSDTARLHEVLQAFGGILKMWEKHDEEDLSEYMISRLERRWKQWEQPLLLLAFLLNPNIPWFGRQPTRILLEFEMYRKRKWPFDCESYEQFEEDVLGFWEFASSSTKELGPLAMRLFGICVNAASIERL